ncbi:hypothetical protein L6452_13433 [Arctium lappa]|uniref:Uncharacterized protein n=1 Tax=Arctium lappa TaxID=4217 RepID=A0ACB9CI62_ARCLA|nr:hypothetical protein L6452_13433 [Arctium lappa]
MCRDFAQIETEKKDSGFYCSNVSDHSDEKHSYLIIIENHRKHGIDVAFASATTTLGETDSFAEVAGHVSGNR